MKEYKFYKIGITTFTRKPKEDYQEIIKVHAAQGWKLVQIFAPPLQGYGYCSFYELIFEKEKR